MFGKSGGIEAREFVVIGLGRFGTSLATTLVKEGHSVLGVDTDPNLVQRHSHEITQTLCFDTTDEEALREADVTAYETAVVAIGSAFEANLMTTVALKSLGMKTVICKASTERQKSILLNVGADRVVLPEQNSGARLAREIVIPSVTEQIGLAGGYTASQMIAPDSMLGLSLADSDVERKYGILVAGVGRDGRFLSMPKKTLVVRPDDEILVIGPLEGVVGLARGD
ncbi:MAG: TrkA family potassium uptake protein [Fimbriimonadaceae bacterium]|nr:TrkA family potassium uptake protein [Fimbriimonadaceae bacterium]